MSDSLSQAIVDGSIFNYIPTNQGITQLRIGSFLLSAGQIISLFGNPPTPGQTLVAATPNSASWNNLSVVGGGTGDTSFPLNQVVVTNASSTTGPFTSVPYGSPAVATTIAIRDANSNCFFNEAVQNLTTTSTVGGTTTLTNASSYFQIFTGSGTQILQLPTTIAGATAVTVGFAYKIATSAATTVTLQTNNASAILTIGPSQVCEVVCVATGSDAASSWNAIIVTTSGGVGVSSFTAGTTGFTPNTATTGAVTLSGTLNVTNGGTGVVSPAAHGLLLGNGASAMNVLSAGAAATVLTGGGASADPTWTTILSNNTLAHGGTNANITASNGAVAYSTASALALSAVGTSGQVLQSNGAAAPTWVSPAAVITDLGEPTVAVQTTLTTIFTITVPTAVRVLCTLACTQRQPAELFCLYPMHRQMAAQERFRPARGWFPQLPPRQQRISILRRAPGRS